ncbi:hypothetical protein Dimus_028922 [Dionaea muscipula]
MRGGVIEDYMFDHKVNFPDRVEYNKVLTNLNMSQNIDERYQGFTEIEQYLPLIFLSLEMQDHLFMYNNEETDPSCIFQHFFHHSFSCTLMDPLIVKGEDALGGILKLAPLPKLLLFLFALVKSTRRL